MYKDECMMTPNLCGAAATCVNTPGSYRCTCNRGFTYDPKTKKCTDTDECKSGGVYCQYGCINLIGGYRCGCQPGFTQDYYFNQCVDQNECQTFGRCGSANCVNTLGSYYCGCNQGYVLSQSRSSCRDVNECVTGQSPCSYGCVNNRGGFSCSCPTNYYPIGGGHCLSPFGEACYECALARGEVPTGGVPLVDQTTARPAGQVGSSSRNYLLTRPVEAKEDSRSNKVNTSVT
ncbi:Fibrillin-2 [Exaiptasia diaphana]|nr:Fibrillin-2 [Exaiptasia diaphana]